MWDERVRIYDTPGVLNNFPNHIIGIYHFIYTHARVCVCVWGGGVFNRGNNHLLFFYNLVVITMEKGIQREILIITIEL